MIEVLYPDLTVNSVQDIDLEMLKRKNIRGLILDIDNTLVPHGKEADDRAVKWIESIRSAGFKACIVSNASRKRVIKFNEDVKLYAIHRASKPGSKAFLRASELMGTMPGETAVVGDQIFTDIYGGNRVNMFTILVKPIDKREFPLIKVKRVAEKIVLSRYNKKKL